MNPLYTSNDSPNRSTKPTKAANAPQIRSPRSHNTFDESFFHFTTEQYGFLYPFYHDHGIPGDVKPLRSTHNLRSLPLSNPVMSPLTKSKDYFLCPMDAILPNTWPLIYKQPNQGDDVPQDAICAVPAIAVNNLIRSAMDAVIGAISDLIGGTDDSNTGTTLFRALFVLEAMCSSGSLLPRFNFHNSLFVYEGHEGKPMQDFDTFFDVVCSTLQDGSSFVYANPQTNKSTTIILSSDYKTPFSDSIYYVNSAQFVDILRDVLSLCDTVTLSFDETVFNDIYGSYFEYRLDTGLSSNDYFNYDVLVAYQMICASFYVNPKVDFIYSADLFRENFYTFVKPLVSDSEAMFFSYNGMSIRYDAFSGHFVSAILSTVFSNWTSYDAFMSLFGLQHSLRFGDYFTDSRTRPYAVGDVSVTVADDNSVSMVDINRTGSLYRFLNAVVKLPSTISDYLRGIFGTSEAPDYHSPKFISHTESNVEGFEVSNTASSTGSLVTNLRTGDDSHAFVVNIDMPCIVMGITYYSMPRVYSLTKSRFFFHKDRYDMFNPFLQNIGDQEVKDAERNPFAPNSTFAYQDRYSEYRQRYSYASGAFLSRLGNWAFICDAISRPFSVPDLNGPQNFMLLRSRAFEYDRFFANIDGYSLGNRFHFIVAYNNVSVQNRPLSVNPSVL